MSAVVRWKKQINYFDPFKVLFKGSCFAYLFTCSKPSYLEVEVRFHREFFLGDCIVQYISPDTGENDWASKIYVSKGV